MSVDQITSILKEYETRLNELDPKDKKKLNSLIEKLVSKKSLSL